MEVQDDPYAILGVGKDASDQDLRRARNHLLLHWHPDRSNDPEAVARAARINAAYEVLSDPARRAGFERGGSDMSLAALLSTPSPVPWTPTTGEGVKAEAQQRVVDRFKEAPRPVRAPSRRWSDTLARPASAREVGGRALRALPFAVLAIVSFLGLRSIEHQVPAAAPVLDFLPVYAVVAVLRALLGRATTLLHEGWGRFTASWVLGVAGALAVERWILPRAPAALTAMVQPVVPIAMLLLGALVVYGLARTIRHSL
ncbi:MAG: J domain-containing protein [Candidatus Dormibacteraceae bacterium]